MSRLFLGDADQPFACRDDFEAVAVDTPHLFPGVEHVAPNWQERSTASIFVDIETRTRSVLDEDAT